MDLRFAPPSLASCSSGPAQENELREKIKVILKEHAEKVAAAPRQEPAPMPAMLIAAKTLASMPVAEVMRMSE